MEPFVSCSFRSRKLDQAPEVHEKYVLGSAVCQERRAEAAAGREGEWNADDADCTDCRGRRTEVPVSLILFNPGHPRHPRSILRTVGFEGQDMAR